MNTVGCYKYIISDLNTHSDYIHATYDDAANAAKDYINTHGTLGMEYRVNIWYYEDSSPSDRYVQQDPFDYKKGTSSGTVTVTLPGDNNSPETTVTTSSTVDPTDSVPPPSQEGGTPSTPSNPSNPSKSSQTWTMSSTKSITYSNNGTFDLDTLITSGTPVGTKTWTITSGDSYASVSGNTLTIKGVGSVGVKLTASGSSSYYSKDASCTITINPASASQGWSLASTYVTYSNNGTFDLNTLVSSVNASGLPIGTKTWSITSGDSYASVSGNTLTIKGVGIVTVKLSASGGISGNYNYSSLEKSCTITINPASASQSWTLSSKSIAYSNNGTFDLNTLVSSVNASGLPIGTKTWSITSGDSYASVSGNTLTIKGVGTVTVKLTASGGISGNYNYGSREQSCNITIYPATAAQSWTLSNKAITFGDNALDMDNAVTGNTIGNKTWSVTNGTGSATIDKSSGVLTPTKGGTVIVKLVTAGGESGNYNYESREQTCTVTINRKNQDMV